jgi:hypothetical protein
MSEHWNIQVNIQHVKVDEMPDGMRALQGKPPTEKSTIPVADIKVTARTEREAFEKVNRLLTALHPDVAVVTADQTDLPARRPIRDNPQA